VIANESWPEGRGTFTGFTPKVYPVAQPIVGADMKPSSFKKMKWALPFSFYVTLR
jgi:hypothetical protein